MRAFFLKLLQPAARGVLVGVVAVLCAGVAWAWTGPLSPAPNCVSGNPGCDAPLNVSATAQTKSGTLSVKDVYISTTGKWVSKTFGGQYLLIYWLSSGATQCWTANPQTGGCSCPTGTTAYRTSQAEYYMYSPWDSAFFGNTCE